jgi:hypothetical protein
VAVLETPVVPIAQIRKPLLKAAGVSYCTSPMGADHTAGLIVAPGQPYEEAMRASQESQIVNAVVDSSGFCQFLMPDCMKQDAIGPEKLVWDLDPELVARAYQRFDPRDELFELRPS